VPAQAITRLIAEKPNALGLAVPGMPIGSPGMEGGTSETYEVILFGKRPPRTFGRFRGDQIPILQITVRALQRSCRERVTGAMMMIAQPAALKGPRGPLQLGWVSARNVAFWHEPADRADRWTTVPYSVSPIPAFRAHEMLGSVASAVSAIQAPMVRGDSRLLEGAGCTRGII
jgi:hypothetical protein